MRFILFLLSSLLFLITTSAFSQNLETYQWKNRIILLKDDGLDSDWLQAQLKRLKANQKEMTERQLLVLLVTDSMVYDETKVATTLNAHKIINTYELSNFKGLVLIGKDGHTKLKEEFIVNLQTIFDLIDSMPMRKTETKATKAID